MKHHTQLAGDVIVTGAARHSVLSRFRCTLVVDGVTLATTGKLSTGSRTPIEQAMEDANASGLADRCGNSGDCEIKVMVLKFHGWILTDSQCSHFDGQRIVKVETLVCC